MFSSQAVITESAGDKKKKKKKIFDQYINKENRVV